MSMTYSPQIVGWLYVHAIEGQRASDDGLRREIDRPHVVLSRLRDVPVLAELAAHVAARGADRENARAGQEVVQGLLLDRIDLEGGGASVAEGDEAAAVVRPD